MQRLELKYFESPSILLVTGSLEGGGAERVISDMANYWADRGWHVTLATWSGPEIQDFFSLAPNIGRIWLNVYSPNDSLVGKIRSNVGRIIKLRKLLQASRPNVVLSFIDVSNVRTILAASGLGVRVVVSERTNPRLNYRVPRFWRALRRISYSWADEVVAQTQDAARWIETKCRVRVAVIPNALRVLPKVAREREFLIIAIGRLSNEKGFDILLRAFGRISPDFKNWRLVIIGEGPDRPALLQLRDNLGLRDRVELIGQVQDVETWLARAGLVVHPSRREGFPNVVLEAMGMGAAVVCANCHSGPSELIQDGINGRLVPVDDVDTLARVMAELMANPDIRIRFGQEASRVRQHYEQSVVMQKWESCLSPKSVAYPDKQ